MVIFISPKFAQSNPAHKADTLTRAALLCVRQQVLCQFKRHLKLYTSACASHSLYRGF
jgi:hypothetical protein